MSRRGFTLIELLVVIAIIAVLIALLLPAVQAAREAARRSQCTNNLKQIALAVMNYESSNGSLPPAFSHYPGDPAVTPGKSASFGMKVRVLPFMEQSAMFNAINFSFAWNSYQVPIFVNSSVYSSTINAYLCPSDANMPGYVRGGAPVAPTNYANSLGTIRTFNGGQLDGPAYAIDLAYFGPVVTLASITDGTSNTAIFSEYLKGRDQPQSPGKWSFYISTLTFRASGGVYTPALMGSMAQSLMTINASCQPTKPTNWDLKGYSWMDDGSNGTGTYSHVMAPNAFSCVFSNEIGIGAPLGDHLLVGPSSNHPGGVNMGFLDGSVHFIKNSINLNTYGALGTRAGGEVVDAGSY